MGRSEDPLKSGVDDTMAIFSIINQAANHIAALTTDRRVLLKVEDIIEAVKRGRNYQAALRQLQVIESNLEQGRR